MPAIFRTPAIGQMRQGIGDVVIRRSKAADIGAACKQLGVNVQKFRIGIPGLELKAMAHALRSFNYKGDRKSTRLNSSHTVISYAVFCLKKKKIQHATLRTRIVLYR